MAEVQGTFDVVVIGGGPGGYTAAIRARQLGLKVALVEREKNLGGICLNWGCIPTKALLKQAELYRLIQNAGAYGIEVGKVGFDWKKVIGRSRQVARRLAKGVDYLMKKNGVEVCSGSGRLTPIRQVEVRDGNGEVIERLQAGNVIIATGSRPKTIAGVEIYGERVISSRDAMATKAPPESLVVIGAGAIGIEFAYFYNAFGTRVKVLEGLPQILPREDAEIAAVLAQSLEKQGIGLETGVQVGGIVAQGDKVEVEYRGEKGASVERAEKVLMAIGVTGNIEALGLTALGVRTEAGAIAVDGRMQTNVAGIYAIGDVVGAPQLAHVAAAEGVAAAEFIAGQQREEIDPALIPSCTYCQPQVASVGLDEEGARAAGYDVKVGRFPFAASGKAQAIGETEGLVKLVFDAKYGEVLGASIVGAEATELIAEIGLARKLEATYEELVGTMHAHPTLSEAVMEAAGEAFGMGLNL